MALVDVDGLSHGRGDGEGDATADLERCVDLFFVSILFQWKLGKERTIPPQRLLTFTGTLANMVVLAVMYAMDTPVTLIRDVGRTFVQL